METHTLKGSGSGGISTLKTRFHKQHLINIIRQANKINNQLRWSIRLQNHHVLIFGPVVTEDFVDLQWQALTRPHRAQLTEPSLVHCVHYSLWSTIIHKQAYFSFSFIPVLWDFQFQFLFPLCYGFYSLVLYTLVALTFLFTFNAQYSAHTSVFFQVFLLTTYTLHSHNTTYALMMCTLGLHARCRQLLGGGRWCCGANKRYKKNNVLKRLLKEAMMPLKGSHQSILWGISFHIKCAA